MWRNYLTVGSGRWQEQDLRLHQHLRPRIGLAACLMILLYVRYELSYDKWLPDAERIYQFQSPGSPIRDRRGEQAADDALRRGER
jgi:putative ABC transport system permease protein